MQRLRGTKMPKMLSYQDFDLYKKKQSRLNVYFAFLFLYLNYNSILQRIHEL